MSRSSAHVGRSSDHAARGPQRPQRMQELKVAVPAGLVAALDHFAVAKGLSRAEAIRLALCSEPLVDDVMHGGGVASRDVLGP